MHPAFQDATLVPPPGFPVCPQPTNCMFTSNKVIVARSYVNQLGAGTGDDPSVNSRPDDASARDLAGHGTSLASAAAGERTQAPLASIIGVAPRAFLGNYKIFGSDEINGFTDSSAIDPAIEDASVRDHMNVAVLSLGGGALTGPNDTGAACGNNPGVPCDLESAAIENALKAGMVVVVAAGNEGESGFNSNRIQTLSSISSPGVATDAITVGAVTNSHVFNSDIKIAGPNVPGALVYISMDMGDSVLPAGNLTGPLVDASKAGDVLACSTLTGNFLQGAIALVTRGTCNFSVKAQNAFAAGAIGMIVVNTGEFPTSLGGLANAPIPSASIGGSDGSALRTYLASNSGVTATIPPGMLEETATPDQIPYFSSVGPALGGGLKPEITAPGVSIYMATQSYDPNGGEYSADGYEIADGTSFSTPLVAGAAALVIQKHPDYSPLQVKSALVNTAARPSGLSGNQVGTASTYYSVLETGAGRLDAGAALLTNVTIEPSTLSFGALAAGAQNLSQNLTLTNFSAAPVSLSIAVNRTVNDSATTLAVDKTQVTIAPNSSTVVKVSLTGMNPGFGDFEGNLEITGGAVPLHVPFLYVVGTNTPNDYILYSGNGEVGTAGQDLEYGLQFRVVDRYGLPVQGVPVTFSAAAGDTATLKNSDTATNQFGLAYSDVTFGTTPCTAPCVQKFTALVGSKSLPFNDTSRAQPAISSGGIADSASFSTAGIVPGSFISLFGTGLSDITDSNTQSFLPLSLDGVFVSFDAPGISLPGRIYFISPGQVNVQVPWELAGATSAKIKVTIDPSAGNVMTVPVLVAAPALFTYSDTAASSTVAAALDENYKLVGSANPVARGHLVQLYANALGPVNNTPLDGYPASSTTLSATTLPVTATVGGQHALVQFSGLAPGFAGLYQVNLTIPANITAGLQPVILTVNGVASPAVNIQVN